MVSYLLAYLDSVCFHRMRAIVNRDNKRISTRHFVEVFKLLRGGGRDLFREEDRCLCLCDLRPLLLMESSSKAGSREQSTEGKIDADGRSVEKGKFGYWSGNRGGTVGDVRISRPGDGDGRAGVGEPEGGTRPGGAPRRPLDRSLSSTPAGHDRHPPFPGRAG